MNFSNLSPEAQRALEWLNLALGIFCTAVGVNCGLTSPRPLPDASIVTVLYVSAILLGIPLLTLTSAILLFSNRRRAALGFFLLTVATVALTNASWVMH